MNMMILAGIRWKIERKAQRLNRIFLVVSLRKLWYNRTQVFVQVCLYE